MQLSPTADLWSDDVLVEDGFVNDGDIDDVMYAFRAIVEAMQNKDERAHARICSSRAEVALGSAPIFCEWAIAERLRALRDRAVTILKEHFQTPAEWPEFSLVTEMHRDDSHPLHADAEVETPEGWRPNHTAWRTRVGLIYLNTCGEDYEGGLLRLPGLDKTIAPRAGMVVAFPSDRRYVHEVTPIESGVRRSLAIWLTADPDRAEQWAPAAINGAWRSRT